MNEKTFAVSSCSPKPSTDSETNGNGLIQMTQKPFCLNIYSTEDNCDDVNVCKVVSYTNNLRQEKFYVPLDRTKNTSKDKFQLIANVRHLLVLVILSMITSELKS